MSEDGRWAVLVPERACSDLAARAFYTDLLGFSVRFEREGFAYLDLGAAQLVLEDMRESWTTGERVHPFGRGINRQIEVADVDAMVLRRDAAGVALFRPPGESRHREGEVVYGQREFLVQDPHGDLVRFAQVLGTRPARDGGPLPPDGDAGGRLADTEARGTQKPHLPWQDPTRADQGPAGYA